MTNTMKQLRTAKSRSGLFVLAAAFFVVPLAAYAQGDDCSDPPRPQCRTISGRVTNLAGNGIGGIAVKIERSGDEVDRIHTNAAGNYTSNRLLRNGNAVYVVTPQADNSSRFAPESRTVALPNNVSGVNFTKILRDRRADFDGDDITDISVFGRESGIWAVRRSSDQTVEFVPFGQSGDILTPGDFNGDGKTADGSTDIAVFRPSNGTWHIRRPNGSFFGVPFGMAGDEPVQADYDGDGSTDIAVFRPSNGTWYIINSGDTSVTTVAFGLTDDLPAPGDYDRDGKTDIAVFRRSNGTWYIRRPDGSFYGVPFGTTGDQPVQADYDGDGQTDIAAVRAGAQSTWYILNSRDNTVSTVAFGQTGDLPVPGDYDGDGKADVAVKRNEGTWYVLKSTGGVNQVNFTNEYPVPRAYLHPIYE